MTLGFIGAGNMAEAIARGIVRSAIFSSNEIHAVDPNPDRQRLFNQEIGITCKSDCYKAAAGSDVVIMAVKPFVMEEALNKIAPLLKPESLIISIAAGISTASIEKTLGGNRRVIRVMPNTPMLVGKGMSGIARGKHATDDDMILAERIFASAGKVVRVEENLIDAITAVSGSGPAYVFFLAEAMAQAGKAVGLDEAQANLLARQTVIGAAVLLEQAAETPAELRRKVTTPKGTTQAAIETMEAGDFVGMMTKAIEAAAKRSKELGK